MRCFDFIKLVEEMRHAQKSYFRTRTNGALEKSKNLEKKVDEALRDLFSAQQNLFEMDSD